MSQLVVSALQLPTLGMNATRLEYYLKQAKQRDADVMLLGEYVLNHFFKEFATMSPNMVKEQTRKHTELLKNLAQKYEITFIAPIIITKKDGYHKTIVKISAKTTKYYERRFAAVLQADDRIPACSSGTSWQGSSTQSRLCQ